jgi:hypothetical protein
LEIWAVEVGKVLADKIHPVLILETYLAIGDDDMILHNDLNLTSEIFSEVLGNNEHHVHIQHKK